MLVCAILGRGLCHGKVPYWQGKNVAELGTILSVSKDHREDSFALLSQGKTVAPSISKTNEGHSLSFRRHSFPNFERKMLHFSYFNIPEPEVAMVHQSQL